MNQNKRALLMPLLIVFIIISGFLVAGKSWLEKKGIDQGVLIVGNLLLFGISLVSFFLTQRSFKATNPHVFVRAVYSSFIVKFFVLAAAAFIYIVVSDKNISKPALFSCMGLYI
ncbi:MAG: hypothetical protein EOO03_15270, partial [Chitinophagaceae bacterium]